MDYFRILNLSKEPFSNSPEPEFFFPSLVHLGCLQKLELAIRLRRGLNVVIGEVGTGKTTLCRRLLLQFTATESDRGKIEAHLIMDPAFTNPREFLSVVAMTFGIAAQDNQDSEWQLKENIKNYLLKAAVDDNRTVVLLIDEGQKLPDFCLEMLREFLNYETNEYKLLQIVIFAQREFEETLKGYKNFADRVNLYYFLGPLNFRETRAMIASRLASASDTGEAPPLFTYPGLWALYRATGGYPRKIVTLCHQVMLALIIQNRSKGGWFLVRSCAARSSVERRKNVGWAMGITLLALSIILVTLLIPVSIFDNKQGKKPSSSTAVQQSVVMKQSVSNTTDLNKKTPLPEEIDEKSMESLAPVGKMPEHLGKLTLQKGENVWRILSDFYGDFDNKQLEAIALANPNITDLNKVQVGEVIKLLAFPADSNPLPAGKYRVLVATNENIDEIYKLYRKYRLLLPSLKLVPYWNSREGLVFAVFLMGGYDNRESAQDMAGRLPKPLASNAIILAELDDDTVFFSNLGRKKERFE
jgi:general secretion pathway protein A